MTGWSQMSMNKIDRKTLIQDGFRLAQRNPTCRICGSIISRNSEMLSYVAHGSQDYKGQICVECVETITEVVNEKRSLNSGV